MRVVSRWRWAEGLHNAAELECGTGESSTSDAEGFFMPRFG